MVRFRDIFTKFIKYKPDRNLPQPICTHSSLPHKQQHTNLIANAVDYCQHHQQKMCIVCSEVHMKQHCVLDLKMNKDLGTGTLRDFNLGHMMMLPLNQLKCICGKPLGNHSNHGICAACGLASCSQKCHSQWQKLGNCTYHQNFYQKPQSITMRSILFQNIHNVQKAKINEWNLACKSPLSYIACYAKANANYVYLQRGYRNYGIPQPELLEKMKTMKQGVDFYTHMERVCTCNCPSCQQRGFHSVGNCEYDCHKTWVYSANLYVDNSEIYHQCQCNCDFCSSGVVMSRHTKYDCGLFCYKSDFNIDKQ